MIESDGDASSESVRVAETSFEMEAVAERVPVGERDFDSAWEGDTVPIVVFDAVIESLWVVV